MTTTPQIESAIEIGPTSQVGNYYKLVIGGYGTGDKVIKRLISCEIFVLTSGAGQEHFARTGANVLRNGVPQPDNTILSGVADVLLDALLQNTLWFKSALTNKNLVFLKVEVDNQCGAAKTGGV